MLRAGSSDVSRLHVSLAYLRAAVGAELGTFGHVGLAVGTDHLAADLRPALGAELRSRRDL